MGTVTSSRIRGAQSVAGGNLDDLLDTLNQVGSTARSVRRRTRHMAGEASWRAGSATNEARRRAMAARDALAGRRTPMPWVLVGVSAAIGAVFGLAAGLAAARKALASEADQLDLEEAAATDIAAPVTLVESTVPRGRES